VRAPEIVYRFVTPTDTAGGTIDILSRVERLSVGTLQFTFTVDDIPKDRIIVLTNVALLCEPGPTFDVEELKIQGVTQTGQIFDIATDVTIGAADEEKSLNWQGSVWIQGAGDGNASLRATARVSANTAASAAEVAWHGLIIPHGNVGSV